MDTHTNIIVWFNKFRLVYIHLHQFYPIFIMV